MRQIVYLETWAFATYPAGAQLGHYTYKYEIGHQRLGVVDNGFTTERSRVQLPAVALLCVYSEQVVGTRASVIKQYNLIPAKAGGQLCR